MEKEKKSTLTITIDQTVDEVIVIKQGQVFRAKTSDGRGSCRDCEMPGRVGRQCIWSMVCSNVTNGARFRRYVTAAEKKAQEEAHEARIMRGYDNKRWSGD